MDEKEAKTFDECFYGQMDILLPQELSDYQVISCLQHHPKKQTYLLEHKQNKKRIICKYAEKEYAAMLKKEMEVSRFQKEKKCFPFFPYVMDCFEMENGTYLIREYVEGETLEEIVERKGELSDREAFDFMLKICDCFIELHQATPPLIYRDLKASNVLFTPSFECFILDMGTLRNYREDFSMDTVFMGTSAVAAPEQYGSRQTDQRTDVFGF